MAILKNTTVQGTTSVRIPIGTTAQRPTPAIGMLRYNSSTFVPEVRKPSGVWEPLYPPGSIMYFARNSAPDGWLKANGASISTTTYAALFANIAYAWGGSGGSFNVPDLRGEFPRSWDDGRGADSGRAFANVQAQDWKGFYQSNVGSNTFSYSHGPVYMGKTIFGTFQGNVFGGHWAAPAAANGTAWDGSEVRPRNRALLACIKY
jgi:phage-related tail fiber protein